MRLFLNRPGLLFALVTLALGALGALGLLHGRTGGSQPVPGGAVGFVFGLSVGLFVTLACVLLRGRARSDGWTVRLVALAGTLAIIGLGVMLTR